MQRISKVIGLVAIGALGLAACGGSDSGSSTPAPETTGSGGAVDTSAPGDDNAGGDLGTIPGGSIPGLSEQCSELYNKYISALGSVGSGETGDISGVFDALKDVLPAELADDADLLASTWTKYEDVLAKYDGDLSKAMSDEDAQKIIQDLTNEDVSNASNAIGDYFAQTCPAG